ncbi:MAG: phage portal protein [Oscillospiraceae bacterium]|nr:phage portal protein [Oscillospiraceae bacterium]
MPLICSDARPAPLDTLPMQPQPLPSVEEYRLYDALRYAVPVIDAALLKIVRLTGGFHFTVENPQAQRILDAYADHVPVNGSGVSLQLFADQMLDSLLTYGNAAGEMLCTENGYPAALRTVRPEVLKVQPHSDGLCGFSFVSEEGTAYPLNHPERILFAALNPPADSVYGVSVLRGLPALSRILMQIFHCIGKNYQRAGNVRYAVTYQPDANSAAYAREHAQEIARVWQSGILAAENGIVQDFVAVGDIGIKVIGAENQLSDTNIPVRQLLEQLISKLSIPPFLLGFSWSATERMSAQQADILTTELEYFRRILSPVLVKIGRAVLRSSGFHLSPRLEWDHINLQDATELAAARLKNAQAAEIEQRLANANPT